MLTKQNVLTITVTCQLLNTGAFADEIHVYEGESIQAAIDAASSGDDVIVHPGTYYELIDFVGQAVTVELSTSTQHLTVRPSFENASMMTMSPTV